MAAFDPLRATGLIHLRRNDAESYSGTCFAFRQSHVVLTAAHCVPPEVSDVVVEFPHRIERHDAVEVVRHPSADIAIATLHPAPDDDGTGYPKDAFWNCVGNWGLGEEFMAYGFPTEGAAQTYGSPTPRLFVGHFQRFLRSGPHGTYLAGEMSIPAPAGLSGGPVFRPGADVMVMGLVTSNVESYSVLHSVDEIDASGNRYKEVSRRVIHYGLALMLSDLEDWLDEHIPHRPGTAHSRQRRTET